MQRLQFVLRRAFSWPSNDETFFIRCSRLRNDMEVNVIHYLVGNSPVILDTHDEVRGAASRESGITYLQDVVVFRSDCNSDLLRNREQISKVLIWKLMGLHCVI